MRSFARLDNASLGKATVAKVLFWHQKALCAFRRTALNVQWTFVQCGPKRSVEEAAFFVFAVQRVLADWRLIFLWREICID